MNSIQVGAVQLTRHSENDWSACFLNGPTVEGTLTEVMMMCCHSFGSDPDKLAEFAQVLINRSN
jgi:hypothetical protein